jgi:hypothetical protein
MTNTECVITTHIIPQQYYDVIISGHAKGGENEQIAYTDGKMELIGIIGR